LSARTKDDLRIAEQIIAEQGSGKTYVTIRTSKGTIRVMLYDETPQHRDNFIRHVESKVYNGVIFHRAIRDFMIQAGDPASRNTMATAVYGAGDAGEPIESEIRPTLFHHYGALAAARKSDEVNPERQSSGSQFYIVTGQVQTDSLLNDYMSRSGTIVPPERAQVYRTIGGTPNLDGAYTIFGRVVGGMKTVEKIAGLPTDYKDRPNQDVFIKSMTVKRKK
jgi:cyclophilin family peptidyl-prolyl cis-trans isomerase